MVFKTKKLVVQNNDSEDIPGYKNINEVPGIAKLLSQPDEYSNLLEFIGNNLDKPGLCMQTVDKLQPYKICRERGEQGDVITAMYGYCIDQTVGTGKDGRTMVGRKYTDQSDSKIPQMYLVKHLSQYGQHFNYLSKHLFDNIKTYPGKCHGLLDNFVVKNDMHVRALNADNELYVEASSDMTIWRRHLSNIADMNYWLTRNLGCCFWDLGFVNGQNYMQNRKGQLKWVDYGGAGIVILPDSEIPKGMDWSQPEIITNFNNKRMLIKANSDFLMLQFLLHIDYWYSLWNNQNTNAHVWSSNIQIDRSICKEVKRYMIPHVFNWEYTHTLYEKFHRKDWTNPRTWKKLRDYLV